MACLASVTGFREGSERGAGAAEERETRMLALKSSGALRYLGAAAPGEAVQ